MFWNIHCRGALFLKCLIVGGAGFLGSHLADSLLEEECEVVVYDDLSRHGLANIKHLRNNRSFEVVKADVLDKEALSKNVDKVDFVFHLAAEIEVLKGIENPEKELFTNTLGTLNVLEACRIAEIEKLVYASSAGVYGEAVYLPQDENHPLNPDWPYGVTKLAGEKYCDVYRKIYGLKTVSLRYSIVYGPREWYGRVLTRFIRRISNGLPPIIYKGASDNVRDFIHVLDAVDATVSSWKKPVSGVFNIGSGVGTSIKELARLVIQASDKQLSPIFKNPKPREMNRKPAELKRLVLDITKAKAFLNFRSKRKLEDWIRKIVKK